MLVSNQRDDGTDISFVADPTGSFVFSVRQQGILISEYVTVPVRFASMLLLVGAVVAELGSYLLREAKARGIIPDSPSQTKS
jgi:hypothetical protein